MRRVVSVGLLVFLLVGLVAVVQGQEATPEATGDAAQMEATAEAGAGGEMAGDAVSVAASDQIVLNGIVMVDSVTSGAGGFLAIHASNAEGTHSHVVGVSPIPAGTTEGVSVMIDGAMATPFLTAMVHMDDNTPGVFEYGKVEGADMPVSDSPGTSFKISGIFAFDQQPVDGEAVIASVISEIGGWLVVHADDNGQPGPVLGQTLLNPGTNAPVRVALNAEGQTPVLWPMIHADDGEIGTYEFGTVENADMPIVLNDVVATRPINVTDAPMVLLADGTPLQGASPDVAPMVMAAADQQLAADDTGAASLAVDVVSVGPGFIDVHADGGGHPITSLGHAPVQDGESMGMTVPLMPMAMTPVTPTVWPMLHSDTNANGVYEYLMIPGVDLPVVYNGMVVTVPTTVTGDMVGMMDATAEADMGGEMTTPEATPSQ